MLLAIGDAGAGPAGIGIGPDEQEQLIDVAGDFTVGASPGDALQPPFAAVQSDQLAPRQDCDIRLRLDALHQVVGHAGAQARAAGEQRQPLHPARQVDRGLAGGIAGADQGCFCAVAQAQLDRGRPIMHR